MTPIDARAVARHSVRTGAEAGVAGGVVSAVLVWFAAGPGWAAVTVVVGAAVFVLANALADAVVAAVAALRSRSRRGSPEGIRVVIGVGWAVSTAPGVVMAALDGVSGTVGLGVFLGLGVAMTVLVIRDLSHPILGGGEAQAHAALELLDVAALIAGNRLAFDRESWRADLPEGSGPQLAYATGMLEAAVRIRLRHLTDAACRPLDWILRTDARVYGTIFAAVALAIGNLYGDGGLTNVVENGQDVLALGGGLWFGARAIRSVRGIAPTPPRDE